MVPLPNRTWSPAGVSMGTIISGLPSLLRSAASHCAETVTPVIVLDHIMLPVVPSRTVTPPSPAWIISCFESPVTSAIIALMEARGTPVLDHLSVSIGAPYVRGIRLNSGVEKKLMNKSVNIREPVNFL